MRRSSRYQSAVDVVNATVAAIAEDVTRVTTVVGSMHEAVVDMIPPVPEIPCVDDDADTEES